MRLRFNKNAEGMINASRFAITSFPYELNENTVLEIGMGKGKMLAELAKNNSNKVFIGMEKYSTPALSALRKIEKESLNNMYILIGDANLLDKYFIGKTSTIWLTFSDPWPKKRHFKRRLVYRYFLRKYEDILATNGIVYFKSDNDDLYEFALEELAYIKANIIYKTTDLHNCNFEIENHFTDYETKFFEQKKNINFIAFNFQNKKGK
ncbi:tRNA (guanosine(46)-N7)-methyltransferase TrmB [Metamycoplasma equirhinis]|uniref:tRNA (guanine-N(7)-)-methyltransferase n=1 Tax=Metamycoplasma equirhinis TaxID=92402 RepID=A0ABZ0PAE5_9BACT|nr:tRNA (guanosine(46)-N7)-methyltransferase TrmB [Metamycoplasma equirhinis]TPD98838.1 tRNA (guanosine(46)-N7)-methyltransferase TrmB [Metamycoplasma equirhinis]WPB54003.1 tRNA (guanosine(46)-N7)-methyltransferase TrmB [Metamycoplasma equirhinis]